MLLARGCAAAVLTLSLAGQTPPARWAAVAPMSGPLVDEAAVESLRGLPIFTVSTGTIEPSRALVFDFFFSKHQRK